MPLLIIGLMLVFGASREATVEQKEFLKENPGPTVYVETVNGLQTIRTEDKLVSFQENTLGPLFDVNECK